MYPEDPAKEGHIFLEWCTIDKTVCSPTNMSNKNMVLHPQWEIIEISSSSSVPSHPKSNAGLIVGLSVGIPVFIVVVVAIVVVSFHLRRKRMGKTSLFLQLTLK